MSQAIILKGGAGGVGSDDVTASKYQVVKGYKTITTDSDDEIIEGTIENRGYHGPDSQEIWYYPTEGGYVVRIEEGYYSKDTGSGLKPYVIAPTQLVKYAINYKPEATLESTTTCGERGRIKVVDTKVNNYSANQAKNYGIDGSRNKFWMLLGHGNAYYCREDNDPHVELNADLLGDAMASDIVSTKKATSRNGIATQGTLPYKGNGGKPNGVVCPEMWYYGNENCYVTRFEPGAYYNAGDYKPYVSVPVELVKQAVNYHSEKTLDDTVTCNEGGKIRTIDTRANNFAINQAKEIGIDHYRRKFWMLLGHSNAYYYREDNKPHVEIDSSSLGNADAGSVLQGQTASSERGIKFQGAIPRWICNTGDVISAVDNNGFAWDDTTGAGRGRGIVTKIPNGHFVQGANYVFLPAPFVKSENIREGVNMFGIPGGLPDYRIGRPVFNGATFNTLYVGGVANKDFPEARIYRDRTSSASNYSRYAGGTTINVSAGSNFHLWSSGQYVGFVLDRAILFTFFRQLKITYKLDVRMNTGGYNQKAGVDVYVHLYDAANRSQLIGGMHKMHSSAESVGSTYNGDTYEMIIDTSGINKDAFVALCASAYNDYNMSSAIGSVTFTKIELIN